MSKNRYKIITLEKQMESLLSKQSFGMRDTKDKEHSSFDRRSYFFYDEFLIFLGGTGILLSLILAIIIPLEPGKEVPINREENMRLFVADVAS